MPSDYLDIESLTEARRKGLEETIQTASNEQLNKLGEMLFPSIDHPWRERFFDFIKQNAGTTFYHATTHDRVHILYCAEKDTGMWFLPGTGMGPLQQKGLKIMKEIVQEL